jgi:hypothetical protein
MRVRLENHPHLLRLMSASDQAKYGPGLHPVDDPHPPPKTDKAEREEQKHFANWLLLNNLMPPAIWHATHKPTKATLGTPDFVVPVNRLTLFIEFKRDYTCLLSPDQKAFGAALETQGHTLYVCYSAEEAIQLVKRSRLRSWTDLFSLLDL